MLLFITSSYQQKWSAMISHFLLLLFRAVALSITHAIDTTRHEYFVRYENVDTLTHIVGIFNNLKLTFNQSNMLWIARLFFFTSSMQTHTTHMCNICYVLRMSVGWVLASNSWWHRFLFDLINCNSINKYQFNEANGMDIDIEEEWRTIYQASVYGTSVLLSI